MRYLVDQALCCGHGQCAAHAPDVYSGSFGGRPRADLTRLGELVATGNLDPSARITQRFPLEEAEVAYRLLRTGEIVAVRGSRSRTPVSKVSPATPGPSARAVA